MINSTTTDKPVAGISPSKQKTTSTHERTYDNRQPTIYPVKFTEGIFYRTDIQSQ